jgi:hypothetical protein
MFKLIIYINTYQLKYNKVICLKIIIDIDKDNLHAKIHQLYLIFIRLNLMSNES